MIRSIPRRTFVASLMLCYSLTAQTVHGQQANVLGERFFKTAITLNDEPLLAEVFYNNAQGNFIVQGPPLVAVISKACGLQPYQIVDGPQWIYDSRLYDIEAVPPPAFVAYKEEQLWQALLEDRFQLEVQRASRTITALVLAAENVSPKLSYVSNATDNGVRLRRSGLGTNVAGFSGTMTLEALAIFLTRELKQPVLDHTGLTGTYAFEVVGYTPNDPGSMAATLLAQLGLKLTLESVEVEVLVITRIEHPALDTREN